MHQLHVLSIRWVAFFSFDTKWGSSQSLFFWLLTTVFIYLFFALIATVFPLDLTSHLITMFTFLPSYVLHQLWYLIYYPLLT
jgi:hypothetical protein